MHGVLDFILTHETGFYTRAFQIIESLNMDKAIPITNQSDLMAPRVISVLYTADPFLNVPLLVT